MSQLRQAVCEFLHKYDEGTGHVPPYFIEMMRSAVIADAEAERVRLLAESARHDQTDAHQKSAIAALERAIAQQDKAIAAHDRIAAEAERLKRLGERIELGLPDLTTMDRIAVIEGIHGRD